MSKSMAIEGVMKIFLMIAVIIVGMSFLMKAFGIDIFEWLKEKFRGFDVPSDGKGLHVKIDKGGDRVQVWDFHLLKFNENKHFSNEEASYKYFFWLKEFPSNLCTIFVTHEDGGEEDGGNFYYVADGAIIQHDCGADIRACIGSLIRTNNECANQNQNFCENNLKSLCEWKNSKCNERLTDGRCVFVRDKDGDDECKKNQCEIFKDGDSPCPGPSHFVNCGGGFGVDICENGPSALNRGFVLDEDFRDVHNTDDACGKEKRGGGCNLLQYNEDERKHSYSVKYGLICDGDSGLWRVCKPDKKGDASGETVDIGNDGYECVDEDGKTWFVWRKQQ